jgi:hypothetical protein
MEIFLMPQIGRTEAGRKKSLYGVKSVKMIEIKQRSVAKFFKGCKGLKSFPSSDSDHRN